MGSKFTNMEGLTEYHMSSMDSYKRLLIELGEKSKPNEQSSFSVEIRLLGLALINTLFFILGKTISSRTNMDVLSLLKGLVPQMNQPKKKMKSPTISFDTA